MDREDLINEFAPVSLSRRLDPTLTECLVTLEGPPAWRQDELTHTKALDSAFHIKNRLQELIEASQQLLYTIPTEQTQKLITIHCSLGDALELL